MVFKELKWQLKFGLGLLAMLFVAWPAQAATKSGTVTYKGIALTPAIENLSLDQTTPNFSFKINIDNHLGTPVTLNGSSLDFKSLNETGGVAFIGSGANQLEHKYGLANWISLPETVTLKAHSSQLVTVSIDNRADLAPGGHYAAVLFKNTGGSSSAGNKVDVNQVVATLVFVKKSGGENFELSTSRPDFGQTWLRLPSSLALSIKNIGNTQTQPRGLVVIAGPRGHEAKRGIINTDSGLVLPESTRIYQTSLIKSGPSWVPGRYHVTVLYRSGDTNQGKILEYSFIYLNPGLFLFFGTLGFCLYRIALANYRSWQ